MAAALALHLLALALPAQTAMENWTVNVGTAGNLGTDSPTLGNGGPDSAVASSIYDKFGGYTLSNIGDSILFGGSMSFTADGTTLSAGQFRLGIMNTNGSSGTTGWLGYWVGNSSLFFGTDTAGTLQESVNPNTAGYGSTSGTLAVADTTAGAAFASGTYAFSLKYQKASATSLDITWTLSNSAGYSLSGSYLDTSVSTFTFNAVFLTAGAGFTSDQVNFSNLSVTAVPEPRSMTLCGLAGLGVLLLLGSARPRQDRRTTG